MLKQSGGNKRMVCVPATPVNTFCSNSNLVRISFIGCSNSMPIIKPFPLTSLMPFIFFNSSKLASNWVDFIFLSF